MSKSILLIKSGFIKKEFKEIYKGKSDSEIEKIANPEHADEEIWEETKDQFKKTGYPLPLKRYRISWETPNLSIEEAYFWLLNHISKDLSYPNVVKTIDAFAASEGSAFFGVSQQRLGLQQDKVSQFLGTIGKMVKEIFQLVRELRIIDERLGYYWESIGLDKKTGKISLPGGPKESSEITLKGIWVDMVEGGAKNPSSVFGMAREIQFTSLPDLFFSTHPKMDDDVDEYIDKHRGGFNVAVRNVLKRKIKMYMMWKEQTLAELKTRKNFTLKYLIQHNAVIKMYMTWVKPYLRQIQRLTFENKEADPSLITAFETSMVEIEFFAHKEKIGQYYAGMLANFLFRTRPSMSFQQEGYQRGPIHVGSLDINFRAYVWTEKQLAQFREFRDKEDLDLMKLISKTVSDAIDAMGNSLEDYLGQAKEIEEKQPETTKLSMMDRIRAEFIGPPKAKIEKVKKPKIDIIKDKANKSKAIKSVKGDMFVAFKNFKKGHGMVMW